MTKEISLNKRIIIALDMDTPDKAKEWVRKTEEYIKFYKVGLQLFLGGGFDIVNWITSRNLEVMIDLKFFDIPQTVANAVSQLNGRGITFATVHGNDTMLESAVQAAKDIKILAVTALTSLSQSDMEQLGFQCKVEDLVYMRAKNAINMGCHGIVSSGLEAKRVRKETGDKLIIVVPGVRPLKNDYDGQKRVVTAGEAVKNGADHIVVGRPILEAKAPVAVIESMQTEIRKALK